MSSAVRVAVPLNSRCSRKWQCPLIAGRSSRDPASTQKPIETERMPGIRSVTTRRPELNSVREIGMTSGSAVLGCAAAIAEPATVAIAAVATRATIAAAVSSLSRGLDLRALGHFPLGTDRLQTDLPLWVDVFDQDGQRVALLDRLIDAREPLAAPELRDMDESIATGNQVDERAEGRRLHHGALVGLPHEDRPRIGD